MKITSKFKRTQNMEYNNYNRYYKARITQDRIDKLSERPPLYEQALAVTAGFQMDKGPVLRR